jgi:predicted metal-binding transcription factor (methanogenesis marker protein 9)
MATNMEKARGLILINGHAYPAEAVLSALERQAMTALRIVGDELWIGNDRVSPITKASAEQVMKLTCYGSLAYCCDLSRQCHLRDETLRLLRMTKDEYRAIQLECHQRFLQQNERRWPQDIIVSPRPESTLDSESAWPHSKHDPSSDWRQQVSTEKSRSAISKSDSITSIDLGGLFDSAPKTASSHSPSYREPRDHTTTRTAHHSGLDQSKWFPSSEHGSTAIASTPTVAQGFCIFCGADLQERSEFCNRCGRNQG